MRAMKSQLKTDAAYKFLTAFTLMECLIVMLLAGILLFCAVPSFQHLLEKYQTTSYVNRIVSALQFARLTAISRQTEIQFCASSDLENCGGNWDEGQLVKSNNEILKKYSALKKDYQLIWKGSFGKNELAFEPDGFINGQQGSFYFYHRNNCLEKIVVAMTGRIRLEKC